jgi:hypothetical protein
LEWYEDHISQAKMTNDYLVTIEEELIKEQAPYRALPDGTEAAYIARELVDDVSIAIKHLSDARCVIKHLLDHYYEMLEPLQDMMAQAAEAELRERQREFEYMRRVM